MDDQTYKYSIHSYNLQLVLCDCILSLDLFYILFLEEIEKHIQKSLTADVSKESSWPESPYH